MLPLSRALSSRYLALVAFVAGLANAQTPSPRRTVAPEATTAHGRAVANVAAARRLPPPTWPQAFLIVSGFDQAGDDGGGRFVWDATSTALDDTGLVLKPDRISASMPGRWLRQRDDPSLVCPLWYGAKRDGTDPSGTRVALQAAFDAVGQNHGRKVYLPAGRYTIEAPLIVSGSPITIVGAGVPTAGAPGRAQADGTIIEAARPMPAVIDVVGSPTELELASMRIDGASTATSGLRISQSLTVRSRIVNVRVEGAIDRQLDVQGQMIGVMADDLHLLGGNYGMWVASSGNLNGASFRQLRITNTVVAFYYRNTTGGFRNFSFFNPTIEGNREQAIDARGGMDLKVFGGWFECNNRTNPDPDGAIELGGYQVSPTSWNRSQVSFFGTYFNHHSSAGGSCNPANGPLIKARERAVHVHFSSASPPNSARIEFPPGTGSGSRVWVSMVAASPPVVSGLAPGQVQVFPPQS
ncbi:MAG: glycosyl hydrolase family 28-related protein [Planctomycetota bacterium]